MGRRLVLLELVEKMRPLHKQRWDEVAAAYNDHIAGKDFCARDADALKRRFMVLAYAKKPSGTRANGGVAPGPGQRWWPVLLILIGDVV